MTPRQPKGEPCRGCGLRAKKVCHGAAACALAGRERAHDPKRPELAPASESARPAGSGHPPRLPILGGGTMAAVTRQP